MISFAALGWLSRSLAPFFERREFPVVEVLDGGTGSVENHGPDRGWAVQEQSVAKGLQKPVLRGVQHQWAAIFAAGAGVGLVSLTSGARSRAAVAIYAASLVLLLTVSAVYHRFHWRHSTRMWLRRADHASIFLLIGGTYTPIALLGLDAATGWHLLALIWSGAAVGIMVSMLWPKAPKFVSASIAVALGWTIVPYWRHIAETLTMAQLVLIALGGVAYTLGALIYAAKRPNPWPRIYGYHELFHSLTLVGAALHMAAVMSIVQTTAAQG